MLVKDFMLPLSEVTIVGPNAHLEIALNLMVTHPECNAIAVVEEDSNIPIGIIAKSDLLKAYQQGLNVKTHSVSEVMGTKIETVLDCASREVAANHFEETHHKNAFVINEEDKFVGMVSALEICTEVARDDHAWPWNREGLHRKYALA